MKKIFLAERIVKLEDVMRVYSGKAGKCMCGCSGTYKVASAHKRIADENRGYHYNEEDVSDRSVKTIFGKIGKLIQAGVRYDLHHSYLALDTTAGRTYVLYFVPSAEEHVATMERRDAARAAIW